MASRGRPGFVACDGARGQGPRKAHAMGFIYVVVVREGGIHVIGPSFGGTLLTHQIVQVHLSTLVARTRGRRRTP